MPVGFLTDEQRSRFGRFAGDPSPDQLTRHFHLDDADHDLIDLRRGDHNRLGFAVQLCTARFLGTFLEDLSETPSSVVFFLARQLHVEQPEYFVKYCSGELRWDHAVDIRGRCGYQDFSYPFAQFRLNRWLYALCWTGTDRPSVLFDRATAWLITHKVLLPGVTVLERHVSHVRSRAQEHIWSSLIRTITPETKEKLEALLTIPDGNRYSILDRLRKGPFRRSSKELVRALRRIDEVRALGIDVTVSHRVPQGRIQSLARYAATARAAAVQRMPENRRLATLVAFAVTLEANALDDALDLLDILITEIFSEANKAGEKARLRTIKDLDAAALRLGAACRVILDPDIPDTELRTTIFTTTNYEDLEAAIGRVETLARPPDDIYYQELEKSWRRVRRFFPVLLKTIRFGATPTGRPIMEALERLANQKWRAKLTQAPLEIVTKGWRSYVVGDDGDLDKKAYVFCCLDRLRAALRRRDLFVAPSIRYADARIGLLSGAAWDAARPTVCRSLGHTLPAEETIAALSSELDATYRAVAARLPSNPAARLETVDGKDDLILSGLDKLEEPPSLIRLREEVNARLPRVELPEILLEIAARTDFTSKFTHVSERYSRAHELATSICAVLMAEACNIGFEPMIRNDLPALSRSRLSWVNQNFIRAETLTEANACLVAEQNGIPLVHIWGGGEVASADGLRFVVPVRTIHAGPNPKYFGYEHGVTYYNLISNQFTGLNAIVVPGTVRDSLYLLAVVLEQQTELHPTEIMSDTGAYSDVVFGLFRLLGYRFSPRIADIGGARYWRIDPSADYGPLNNIARHRIKTGLIKQYCGHKSGS
jgi:TnpA family transposase